jgi:hypothetical protein
MVGVLSLLARTLLLGVLLHACARAPVRDTGEPSRAPVVSPHDSSWARLSRACPADAPIRLAPVRPPPAQGRVRARDAQTAALSREAPGGFGGLFIDYDPPSAPGTERRLDTRHVVVFLVDTTQREAALRALESPTHPDRLPLNVVGARIRPARWSFAELYDWYGVLLNVLARDGIVTTGIDQKHNRILFGVKNAAARQRLERQLARLDLPCFLVGVRVDRARVPG